MQTATTRTAALLASGRDVAVGRLNAQGIDSSGRARRTAPDLPGTLAAAAAGGGVHIEDPMRFARYVLRDQPKWTESALESAMHSGAEQHVRLNSPIPVHIVYFTSWVDERGRLHFAEDVYGFDKEQRARESMRLNTAVVGGSERIS